MRQPEGTESKPPQTGVGKGCVHVGPREGGHGAVPASGEERSGPRAQPCKGPEGSQLLLLQPA